MYYIGIDLGGTKIAAGVVDEEGRLLHKDSVPTLRHRTFEEIARDMAMLAIKVVKDSGVEMKEVASIGVGLPGSPNKKDGILIYMNNIDFVNAPIRTEIQKYIDLPVYIENDANCAALAESVAGAAKGVHHSVTITLGTGVGSGVIIDGKIYSGFNDAAAELGHMVIIADGEQCTCGRKGCWEAYASATALISQTKEAALKNPSSAINTLVGGDLDKVDAKTAFDAAKQGDETGWQVVEQYIKYVGVGLTNVINMLMPEVLVIGGGVCKEGEYLVKPLREYVMGGIYGHSYLPLTEIRVAEMGNDAGIVGAAMLGKNV